MLLLAVLLMLAACATIPGEQAAPVDRTSSAPEPAEPATGDPAEDQLGDELDSELLFHVLAGERLGAVGDHEEALGHFLEAVRLSDDPDLARQVISLGMRIGDWQAVAEGAHRWRELSPDEPAALQYGVLALVNLGEVDLAAEWLAALIDSAGASPAAWREAMMLLAAAERDEAALATLDRLAERVDDSADRPELLANRSFLLWQLDRSEQALAMALEATEQGGGRNEYIWAAQLAVAEQQLELALQLYRQARAIAPEDRDLALSEAEVLRQLDRADEAVELLEGLPADSEILYTVGSYLYHLDRLEEAAEAWSRMTAMEDPDDPVQHAFLVAFLAELLGQDEQALSWYERVDSGPNENRAMMRRAILEARQGSLLSARNLLAAIRLGNDRRLHNDALLVEADILREAGQPDEAVRLLSAALREQPNNIAMLYTRAISAVAMDDLDLAEQDFRRILQIDDDNAMALNALGYTLTDRTSRHQEAYRLIRRALELEPDSPPILDSMGWVYFRLGQPERALPYLEQALAGEDNPEIAAHLGEVLWALGREEEALEILASAQERFPGDDYLAETLERLGLPE